MSRNSAKTEHNNLRSVIATDTPLSIDICNIYIIDRITVSGIMFFFRNLSNIEEAATLAQITQEREIKESC